MVRRFVQPPKAATVAVCLAWYGSVEVRASDGTTPNQPSKQAGDTSSAQKRGISFSGIEIESAPFMDKVGAPLGKELFRDGTTNSAFECTGFKNDEAALEGVSIGVRNIHIQAVGSSDGDSLSDHFRPLTEAFGGAKPEQPKTFVTDVRLNVTKTQTLGQVLVAGLEPPVPKGTTYAIDPGAQSDVRLTILYECVSAGEAIVQLTMRLENSQKIGEDICLQWVKVCDPGFNGISITEDGQQVMAKGKIVPEWASRMNDEGATSAVTRFAISSSGVQWIKPVKVSTNQKLVSVQVRGPAYFDVQGSEITETPSVFTIIYTCEYDGHADVTLFLERHSLSGRRSTPTTITWKKVCGTTAYKHLNVFIKSDAYKNKTLAVSKGEALPGFMRACSANADSANLAGCGSSDELLLEIPARDAKSVLELQVPSAGLFAPPLYQPSPDISFDRRVMHVSVVALPRHVAPASRLGNNLATRGTSVSTSTMSLKYTCFADGESIVMVTLHVLAHKPIDFAWKKQCVEPKVRQGKALTAPQALVMVVLFFGIVALIVCLICFFCVKDDTARDDASSSAREMELGSKRPKGGGMGKDRHGRRTETIPAERVGLSPSVEPGGEGEIIYH
eukprot:TRINITY_DN50960_c0_g1_i1.p1 TRINITY_DN50960_c0_g1~~TRINITY_DN50960_c0_g1_i1.p1  ORF type:complete len:617 (+),score=80.15 TRINITY_DN50960_c0_g1_i1:77-1927(+)